MAGNKHSGRKRRYGKAIYSRLTMEDIFWLNEVMVKNGLVDFSQALRMVVTKMRDRHPDGRI